MRRAIRHGAILSCDFKDCKTEFHTFSMISVVRAQAANAGWYRCKEWQLTGDMHETAPGKADACPEHRAIAIENLRKRDQILADKRAAEKAARDKERSDKEAARVAEVAARKAERDEKRAAKETIKAAKRAARDAERADRIAAKQARTKYRDDLKAAGKAPPRAIPPRQGAPA